MADVITRLKVESSEYDAKIKRAAQGIAHLERSLKSSGKSFADASRQETEYVRALGQMETVSRTAKGKINELTQAFTELSMMYKQMSDQEKQSPIGQALSQSLDQLKGRINDTKGQLSEVNAELGNTKTEGSATGSVLEQLAGKFGMSVKGAGMLGAALAAGKVAMESFEKTMQATEGTADLLASAQMQLNSVVDGFFRSINEGNFGNFLSGLSDIANRAREAYEAMDELSSYAVRYNPKNQSDMREIDKLLKEARALQAKGDKAGAAAKTAAATRIANQAKQNTIAYGETEYQSGVATLRSLLGGTGVNFTNGQIEWYSDPKNWDRIKQKASEYKAIQAQIDKLNRSSISATSYDAQTRTKNLERIRQLEASITDEQRRAFTYLNTRDTAGTEEGDMFIRATQQIYGRKNAEFAVDAIQARIDRADAAATRPTGGGGRTGRVSAAKAAVAAAVIPEGSVAAMEKELQDLRKAQSFATDTETWKELGAQIAMVTYEIKKLKGEIPDLKDKDLGVETAIASQDFAKGFRSKMMKDFRQQANETADEQQDAAQKTAKAWSTVGNAVNTVGGALAGLEDPAAQVMGTIAQAIANIALSFSQALLTPKDPFTWIAAAATGTATMLSVISAIKSATEGSYATGGIVSGSSYSGDNQLINVNSGEVVLTRAMAGNLASQLQGNLGGGRLEAVVSGEQLRFILNNNSRRRSRGEYVTTKMQN